MQLIVKIATDHHVSLPWLICVRSLCALSVVTVWIARGPGLATIRTKRPMAHVMRSTLGVVGFVSSIVSLKLLALPDAITITFSAPVLSTLLSALLLREPIGRHRGIAVAIGFLGVLVVANPFGHAAIPIVGASVAMLAALCSALTSVLIRQLGRSETVGATVFWFMLTTSVVGLIVAPFGTMPTDPLSWLLMLLVGLGSGVGQILLTASLRNAQVAVLAPFDFLQIPLSMAFGWLVWSELPTTMKVLGAAMIAGSGIWIAVREARRSGVQIQASPAED
jgi:drug/metabolite transporter (DMT)-like permease